MSLQVWLPLNGNLNNQGIFNSTIANNGATVNTSGKIGSCYNFDGSNDYITTTYPSFSNTISFALWVYFNAAPSGTHLFEARASDSVGYQLMYVTSSTIQIGCTQTGYTNFSYSFTSGKWYHIAVTHDSTSGKCYINGSLIGTSSNAGYNFNTNITARIGCRHTSTNWLNGKVNDVRIYNHCLSAKEVEELSKGLVLHYKLDDAYMEPTTNFDPFRSSQPSFGCMTTCLYGNYFGRDCWHVICLGTSTGWIGSYSSFQPTSSGYSVGDIITRSCDVYIPGGQNQTGWYGCPYAFEGCSNVTKKVYDLSKLNTWLHCWSTATISSTSSNFLYYWFAISGGTCSIEFYITNMQCEKKDHSTPYTPSSRSTGIIYDSSGYGYNGTVAGTLNVISDTGRYKNSTYWPTASSAANNIHTPTIYQSGEAITMSIWIKTTTTGGNSYQMPFESNSRCYCEMSITSGGELRGGMYVNGTRYVQNVGSGLLNGNWHMISITYNGTTIKRYIDGVSKGDTSITGTLNNTSQSYWLGVLGTDTGYYNSQIYLADARLYATALTPAQILELYNTSASIDNQGNLHVREIIEN